MDTIRPLPSCRPEPLFWTVSHPMNTMVQEETPRTRLESIAGWKLGKTLGRGAYGMFPSFYRYPSLARVINMSPLAIKVLHSIIVFCPSLGLSSQNNSFSSSPHSPPVLLRPGGTDFQLMCEWRPAPTALKSHAKSFLLYTDPAKDPPPRTRP